MINFTSTRRLTTIAFLSAVGSALFVLESYIPMPLPFLKIGLANISSVIALMVLGTTGVLTVVALRVVVGSVLVGTFMSPSFVLALSAGVASAAAMAMVKATTRNFFSPFGLSLIGSVAHIFAQLMIARFVYVENVVVLQSLPLLLLTALIGGSVVGWISVRLLSALQQVRV